MLPTISRRPLDVLRYAANRGMVITTGTVVRNQHVTQRTIDALVNKGCVTEFAPHMITTVGHLVTKCTIEAGDKFTGVDGDLTVNHVTSTLVELTGDGRMVHTGELCQCDEANSVVGGVRFEALGTNGAHGIACRSCRCVRQFG
jgi:hypothetical protein